jgi:uncharacterized protein YbjT (DUF2867 family)
MTSESTVLVVGGTGYLGSKVVRTLAAQGKPIRALVRPGTDASSLEQQGVEIVRGNLLDLNSLLPALEGVSTLITTAIGYSRRKRGDSLTTDDQGNRNLVDAAKTVGVSRFIFTSILTAEKARSVPHFYQKALTENYLERSSVPFVALRPGGFLDTLLMFAYNPSKGVLNAMADPTVKASTILSDDVARFLVASVDNPAVLGKRIDLGIAPPTNLTEIAAAIGRITGRPVKLQQMPPIARRVIFGTMGLFNQTMRENQAAMDYVSTGQYVADTSMQQGLFGYTPTLEDSLARWAAAVAPSAALA